MLQAASRNYINRPLVSRNINVINLNVFGLGLNAYIPENSKQQWFKLHIIPSLQEIIQE